MHTLRLCALWSRRQSLADLYVLSCKCKRAEHQLILGPERLIKGSFDSLGLGGGQSGCVGVAGVALTPLHLLNTNFSPPVPDALKRNTFSYTHKHAAIALLHPVCPCVNIQRGWKPIMTPQVHAQVTQFWKCSLLHF